jgi:hypothetical protein
VDEGDDIALALVVGGGKMAVDHELETMLRLVIDDFAHSVATRCAYIFSVRSDRIEPGRVGSAPAAMPFRTLVVAVAMLLMVSPVLRHLQGLGRWR